LIKTHLITFTSKSHVYREEITNPKISKYFDYIKNYRESELSKDFIEENFSIFNEKRGFGYWIWKPWIIIDYLNNHVHNEDDIIVYIDAGDTLDHTVFLSAIKKLTKQKIYAIHGPHANKEWTKRDCFLLMGCDEEKFYTDFQIYSSLIVFKKNEFTLNFFNEWQKYCLDRRAITDDPNVLGKNNFPEFKEHRHDQSIFHNLMIKYGIETVELKTPHDWSV
jgi:hypothetical protein